MFKPGKYLDKLKKKNIWLNTTLDNKMVAFWENSLSEWFEVSLKQKKGHGQVYKQKHLSCDKMKKREKALHSIIFQFADSILGVFETGKKWVFFLQQMLLD